MSAAPPPHPISPPPGAGAAAQSSSGVRRHHTITATSRTARSAARNTISEEDQEPHVWNNDEVVDQDWAGAAGAVGEKGGSLHRQSSLPTRYNRAYGQGRTGARTPQRLNSLTAIDGQEGEEEDWERDMRDLRDEEEASYAAAEHSQHQHVIDAGSQGSGSPLSPHFAAGPSPPPADSAVRRHQSLTYGAATAGVKRMANTGGLRRAGTLQSSVRQPGHPQTPSPTNADEEYADYNEGSTGHEDESYFARQPGQYPTSPIGRSPWGTPGNGGEWRTPGGGTATNAASFDEVQRALSSLDINGQGQSYPANAYPGGQSTHPPRFNPNQPPPAQLAGMRNGPGAGNNGTGGSHKLQLVTNLEDRNPGARSSGPASASAYVPPIGHGLPQAPGQHPRGTGDDRAFSATGSSWDQKERILTTRTSNPNMNYGYSQGGKPQGVPNVPPIPAQYLNQQGGARIGGNGQGIGGGQQAQEYLASPLDPQYLANNRGYNPATFDIRPPFARYFVIKSYTEDDVHKSLKYEIWSSTDPGNKRLDKAFKETSGRGPIYLFFSVNASGHFCGMAEMLTPVDYTRSSTVWASDKWKGVFTVKWHFVRDIPNANLRHIRLNNTQERKPVTNSRDTQELLPDAGQEMLRIFHTHPARTSLLQDFAFYEFLANDEVMQLQSYQKNQPPKEGGISLPAAASPSPPLQQQQQQQQFTNINNLAFASQMQMAQMNPMMQMQMSSFVNPHTMQSLMRNPSPAPVGQNFTGASGVPGFSS
ncbi:YT521-B-like domain-containing protein [Amylostereum chailletii]|nr:YT521-B-like domain-containing protein [Amylostereum chailletii]